MPRVRLSQQKASEPSGKIVSAAYNEDLVARLKQKTLYGRPHLALEKGRCLPRETTEALDMMEVRPETDEYRDSQRARGNKKSRGPLRFPKHQPLVQRQRPGDTNDQDGQSQET